MAEYYDIAVVGGGPTGLVAAIALATLDHRVALLDPQAEALPPRGRTTAILAPQVDLLRELGLWDPIEARTAPLKGLRIVNRVAGAADEAVLFGADELDADCFGWNVVNADLVSAARNAVTNLPQLQSIPSGLTSMRRQAGMWSIQTDDGAELQARLVIACDGKRSRVRDLLRIGARVHQYGQKANTAQLTHSGDHDDISTEVHKAGGPFTTVPLGAGRSSLVWLENAVDAEGFASLNDAAFGDEVSERAPWLGEVTGVAHRSTVDIVSLLAHRFAGPGALLIGESAHAVSPLGAQGFNLSLRDCATLRQFAQDAGSVRELAAPERLRAYERARMGETNSMFWLIDAMNRAVQVPSPAWGRIRGFGLQATARLAPLRQQLMRRLMAPKPATLTASLAG